MSKSKTMAMTIYDNNTIKDNNKNKIYKKNNSTKVIIII